MTAVGAPGGLTAGPLAWIGIDPGGRWCGIALRARGARHLGHAVIEATEPETPIGVGPCFFTAIREEVAQLRDVWAAAHPEAMPPGIAVEIAAPPGGYDIASRQSDKPRRNVRLKDVMGLAATFGAVLDAFPEALMVPRDGFGTRPLVTYPQELVTDGERGVKHRLGLMRPAGKGADVNHARSAWDCAGMAELMARTRGWPPTVRHRTS